jgi:CRP-like cAMP-binding protein
VQRDIEALVSEHPFFQGMSAPWLQLIAGCGKNVHFAAGQLIARAGEAANEFYAIRRGRAAIELHSPERTPLILQTLEEGEILGWSWLFPPYRWVFDARAIEPVSAIGFDGACLRGKCERDHDMGFEFMKRFARVFMQRLEGARLQLSDLYGSRAP